MLLYQFKDGRWGQVLLLLSTLVFIVACDGSGISDTEHVQRAKQFEENGDLKATLIELKTALQQNPANSEARLLLGELYVRIGNGAAAEKELNRARELGMRGGYMQKQLGQALLMQGRYGEVQKILQGTAVESDADLLVLRGRMRMGLGQLAQAQADFDKALQLRPGDVDARLGIIDVALDKGQSDEAAAEIAALAEENASDPKVWLEKGHIAQRLADSKQAEVAYRRVISLDQSNLTTRVSLQAHRGLAKLLIAQDRLDEAVEQVDWLLRAQPKSAQTNYLAGLLAYRRGDYRAAMGHLQSAIKRAPEHVPSLFLLGSVNYVLGNFEQAEQQIARVVAMRPSLLPARMILARIRLRQAKTSEALEVLETALTQDSDDIRLLAMAGEAALKGGEADRGIGYLKRAVTKAPESSGLRSQLAMLYLAEKNDAMAVKELEKAISLSKTPEREKALLALTLASQGELVRALDSARDLVKQQPESAEYRNLLGVLLVRAGKPGLAREAFEQTLNVAPTFAPALLNLARIDVLQGRLREARERLDAVMVLEPGNVAAMLALAQLADTKGDRRQALTWLEKARVADQSALDPRLLLMRYYSLTGEMERAREIAREALAIDDKDPTVLAAVGRVEIALHDYATATRHLNRLAELAPSAQAYYLLGVAEYRAGHHAAAQDSLQKAIRLNHDLLAPMSLLTLIEMDAGHYAKAQDLAREIQHRHEESPAGFELEGDILAKQQRFAPAEKAYAQAMARSAGRHAMVKRADLLRQWKGDRSATEMLSGWLKHHPHDNDARYLLAVLYSRNLGQREQAMIEYRKLLREQPNHIAGLNDLAWLLAEGGHEEEAMILAEKAYELQPESGPVLDTLGWLLVKEGKLAEGIAYLRQASERLPENAEVGYHLASALAQSGKDGEARRILERLLTKKDDFMSRREAESLLNRL